MGGAERLCRVVDENLPNSGDCNTVSERNPSFWDERYEYETHEAAVRFSSV